MDDAIIDILEHRPQLGLELHMTHTNANKKWQEEQEANYSQNHVVRV